MTQRGSSSKRGIKTMQMIFEDVFIITPREGHPAKEGLRPFEASTKLTTA